MITGGYVHDVILSQGVRTMPNNGYFDIKHDIAVINAGDFFCEGCLVGKPTGEVSPDPRYCQGCYEFLLKEAEMDGGRRSGDWKPEKAPKQTVQVPEDVRGIMSTLESKKFEVAIINPPDPTRAVVKRGPKHKPLPQELITQWATEDMGSKAIATKLKAEYDITVSYKTIQRILSGERKQLALPIDAT